MPITTYLLGAGASANKMKRSGLPVLPTNVELASSIHLMESKVRNEGLLTADLESRMQGWGDMVNGFNRFSEVAWDANSLDTIAQAYFSKGDAKGLNQLKAVLSAYFMIEQSVFGHYDTRYDSFVSWLISGSKFGKPKLRNDVRILSWNYDYQFELGWWRHSSAIDLSRVHHEINLLPRGEYVNSDENSFSIIKLNGTVGSKSKYNQETILDLEHRKRNSPSQTLQSIVRNFERVFTNDSTRYPALEYAFEKDHLEDRVFKSVQKEVCATDTLIAIGYSFPAMNETFDIEILKSMPKLTHAILQSPPSPESEFSLRTLNNYLSKAGHSIIATAEPSVSEFLRP